MLYELTTQLLYGAKTFEMLFESYEIFAMDKIKLMTC